MVVHLADCALLRIWKISAVMPSWLRNPHELASCEPIMGKEFKIGCFIIMVGHAARTCAVLNASVICVPTYLSLSSQKYPNGFHESLEVPFEFNSVRLT